LIIDHYLMTLTSHSLSDTLRLGELLGRVAPAAALTCIALEGQLGAGKTQLTRGIASGAAVDDPTLVSSPTYVLLNIYQGPKPVYHMDAYRVSSEEDWESVGLEEVLNPHSSESTAGRIAVIEWASRVTHLLPADRLEITIEHGDDSAGTGETRELTLHATGPEAQKLLAAVQSNLPSQAQS
jgi:tRNA threonylcarbamoyladenosine biosynthesis protein TsaE